MENTCVKFSVLHTSSFMKKNSNTGAFFCEVWEIFRSIFFYETPPMTYSQKRHEHVDWRRADVYC